MNIANLNWEELQQLHALLNKINPQPVQEVKIDPINQMIDEIMEEFNFNKVQDVMDYLNWRWAGEYVTMDMLRETAERLLRDAARLRLSDWIDEHWEQGVLCATGGFQAMAFCNEDKTKIVALDLKFVLTDWEAEIRD